jgi:glycosyltransferase involved in cell wall biosynthesis
MNSEFSEGMVSVMIPVFNRAEYIAETLESIYSQTYKNIEIIAIDDGSTDGSFEYLELQRDVGKIQLIAHENRVNKGQSAALNLGLEKAKGQYIAILDSDDVFEVDKLQLQVEFLSNNPGFGLVYGNATATNANGEYIYDIEGKFDPDPNDPSQILLDCYYSLPSNSLVSRECYVAAGGFNELYRASQDHDMLIRLCEVTNVGFIPQKMFKYRKHGGSISQSSLLKRWSTGFKILNAAKARYPYKGSTIRKRRAVLHFRMFEVYSAHNADRNLLKGLLHLSYAGVLDPIRALKHLFVK